MSSRPFGARGSGCEVRLRPVTRRAPGAARLLGGGEHGAVGTRLVERVERVAARHEPLRGAVVQSLNVRQMRRRSSGRPGEDVGGQVG